MNGVFCGFFVLTYNAILVYPCLSPTYDGLTGMVSSKVDAIFTNKLAFPVSKMNWTVIMPGFLNRSFIFCCTI